MDIEHPWQPSEKDHEILEMLTEELFKQFIKEVESDMNNNNREKNPFAKPDGSPIDGKEFEWLDWAIKDDEKWIATLSPEEQEKVKAARKHMADKMQS